MKRYDMDSEDPSIWKASYEGSDQELAQMLANGADPNEPALMPGGNGRADSVVRPLDRAVSSDRDGAVRLLIKAGAEVDAADEEGMTPLMIAAWFGCDRSVKVLLEGGADPNLRNQKGASALHYASCEGLMTEAVDLLEHGAQASLAFKDELGRLPMDFAIREGSLALVGAMAARMDETMLREVEQRWSSWVDGQDHVKMRLMDLDHTGRDEGQRLALLRIKAALRPLDEAYEIDKALPEAGPVPGARGSWL